MTQSFESVYQENRGQQSAESVRSGLEKGAPPNTETALNGVSSLKGAMKIMDVDAIILESPQDYAAPSNHEEANGVKYCLLLKITTDAGITGWSDVETAPHVAAAAMNAPATGMNMMEGIRELLIGEDPLNITRIWDKIFYGTIYYGRRGVAMQLLSGIDIALHDIFGKAINQPLYRLLGGAQRKRIRAYASTLFRPTPDDMKQACEHYLKLGFRAIKFGWGGFGVNRKRDCALVEAARKTVGTDVTLMVDAGWRMNSGPQDVIERLRDIEAYDIYWYEDFLPPDNYEGYARVKESGTSIRLAAGEQEATSSGFRSLIEQGRIDIIQPDLSRCGGLTEFRRIVYEAERASVDICPHAWLTDLLTSASLHVNACLKRSLFLEYNVSASPMLRDIIQTPIALEEDGTLAVPEGPGLGVEINEDAVKHYRVSE